MWCQVVTDLGFAQEPPAHPADAQRPLWPFDGGVVVVGELVEQAARADVKAVSQGAGGILLDPDRRVRGDGKNGDATVQQDLPAILLGRGGCHCVCQYLCVQELWVKQFYTSLGLRSSSRCLLHLIRRAVQLGARVDLRVVTVHLHQLLLVKLGGAQHLDLADVHVLQGVDASARLFDLTTCSKGVSIPSSECCNAHCRTNGLGDKLANQVLEVAARALLGDDLKHLFADLPDLAALGVARLLDLLCALLRECYAEEAQEVAVGGLDIHCSLNQRLPLFHQAAQLVGGEVHALCVFMTCHVRDAYSSLR